VTKRECRVKVTLGPELGIGLGNTTDRAYTINVCMWDSAMCKDRKKKSLGKQSSDSIRYGKGKLWW